MINEDVNRMPPVIADRLQRMAGLVLGTLAAALVFAMMCVTVVDVVGRYGFNRPLPGAFEITEIMLAMAIFVALPLVTLENGHITASLLADRLAPRARRTQGALVSLFSAVALALIAWRLYRHGAQLSSYGDVTIFLRLPKGPLAYGMASLAALGALAALASASSFLRKPSSGHAGTRLSLSDKSP